MATLETKTAGGVVINSDGDVLVVNQKHNSWSLPKGHIDPGEDAMQAALREIKEESGLTKLKYLKDLGSYSRYKIALDGGDDTSELKTMFFFLFKTSEMVLAPEDPDNPEACWVRPDQVTALLTHQKDKEFFDRIKHELL